MKTKDASFIICSHCGTHITKGPVYILDPHNEGPKPLQPVFCGKKCAIKYNPTKLTQNSFNALCQWFKKEPDETISMPGCATAEQAIAAGKERLREPNA